MEDKKNIDMLRFYGGDIRKRTVEGKFLVLNSSKNPRNTEDLLWGDIDAYRTLNALLFNGYENEKERIFKEKHQLNTVFIELLEITLEIYTGAFSIMCEERKKQLLAPKVKRVDRQASLSAYTNGYTGSFVSCSKKEYEKEFAKKNKVILLEIEASEDSPYVDFQQIVTKEEYSHYDEQEVLFPPFLPLSIEKMSLTEQETHIKDMFGNPPVGKYLLKMGAFPDYRKIITSSKEELLGKILSTKGVAATCLRNMNAGLWDYDYQEYVNWKEDLHNYLKLVYSDLWYGEEENKESLDGTDILL